MPNIDRFLDKTGVKHLWEIIKAHLNLKVDKAEFETLREEVNNLDFLTEEGIELYGGSATNNVKRG